MPCLFTERGQTIKSFCVHKNWQERNKNDCCSWTNIGPFQCIPISYNQIGMQAPMKTHLLISTSHTVLSSCYKELMAVFIFIRSESVYTFMFSFSVSNLKKKVFHFSWLLPGFFFLRQLQYENDLGSFMCGGMKRAWHIQNERAQAKEWQGK